MSDIPSDSQPGQWAAMPSASASPRDAIVALRGEVAKVVVGQEGTLSGLIAALLVRGHVLLEGVPGVAKTLLVKALATALDVDFKRVQFTPDLMPSDVTGQTVLEMGSGSLSFREGPIFTNLFLADEINRTPPKTQASLLEAMEERQVSVEGSRRALPDPFIVIATQNPVEYEGTYPLPEAQLDRFLFKLLVGYPTFEQEREVLARHHRGLDPHDVVAAGVRPVAVSPRGAAALLHAAKAWAWISERPFLTADEVKAVAKPVLRHRLIIRPELELEGTTADGVLDALLATVPAPR